MEIDLCILQLHKIERLRIDSISIFLFDEVKPLKGLASIVDWRMGGKISQLMIDGVISGKKGQNFLMDVKRKMGIWKLFGFGLGKRENFKPEDVEGILRRCFKILIKASVHSTVLSLPGRDHDFYPIESGLNLTKKIKNLDFDIDKLIIADRFDDIEKVKKKFEI